MNPIVLFDGDCHFCHSSVQFIIKRDSQELFYFASQQSEAGQELLKQYGVPEDIDSLVLIENGKAYIKSTAALRICRHLCSGWNFLYFFRCIPNPIRDAVYDFAAKNRYRWFSKKDSCPIPPDSIRTRFLEVNSI
ncbi:thiol-disulfide oxidoreductase DCC family protein [Bacillus benzoevorans]|uniref:Putative DCC family thiol-disulfide oxidoreductase YuxK n=1 Tax=Bacillus benzoevorans TaxID=1456 RepID=A0A7X0HP32_9BACI|nr:thiol-disulfide oxidoreductase DCC family protein [Bacillus benzoevorans]MBB6444352.1 putative DCC family thiol-disulfide oxidoreductase YuxK [Bacillus benzoevorans]